MFLHVMDAKYLEAFKVWVAFNDGSQGVVDLKNDLKGPVFEPLHNLELFKRVQYDRNLWTICWPNGADFAPEFLRKRLQAS